MNSNLLEFSAPPNPYWIASTPSTNYPALAEDIEVDVAIVGGGIVGITAAYLLKKEGLRVAVIEADRILQGTTGHSTAKITSQHHLIYARIKKEMGQELAQQYADANQSAIDLIELISRENQINCDFSRRPAYVYTQSDQYIKDIEDEVLAASELGIKAAFLEEIPLPFKIKAAMRFDNQAQFHPLKFLKALAEKIPGGGSHVFEQTEAVDIEEGDPAGVLTRNGNRIKAQRVIIASHFPYFDGGGLYFSRIYLEKSYIVAVKLSEAFAQGMFISTEDPPRSLRSQSYDGGEIILVAGENHKTGYEVNTTIHYQNLLNFAKDNFAVQEVLYRWSTQDCMTIDGVPFIGHLTRRTPHLLVATGFGKWGISNGTAAAIILKDLITKGDNPWAQVYNPSRFTPSSIKTFLVQNFEVAKNLVSGKLEKLPEAIEVPKGEARVIDMDGQRVGAYRDEGGKLYMVDTTCTHLGCELKWNDAEKSWDCPCHGSRFTYRGDIVEGPAINPLHHTEEAPNVVEAKILT